MLKNLAFGNTQSENVIGFLPKIKHSFLKIDVEGAETEVIEGLKNWIDEYRPIIIAEVLPAYTADNTFRIERQNRIALLLSKMNYVILRMHKDTNDIKVTRHEDFGIISEIKLSDYIFYPREIESEISQLFKFGYSSSHYKFVLQLSSFYLDNQTTQL